MSLHKPVIFMILAMAAGSASANSAMATIEALGRGLKGSVNVITDTTRGTSNAVDHKTVRAAREDAAGFVASDGALRGVHLEAALQHLRQHDANAQLNDMQLAEAILNTSN